MIAPPDSLAQDAGRFPQSPPSPERQLQAWTEGGKPAINLPDQDGHSFEVTGHGSQILLIHFFATWCAPCRPELASLNRLAERQPSARLAIIAVDVGEVRDRIRNFLATSPVRFPVLLDTDRRVTKAWGVYALPTTFVLDAKLAPRLFVEGDLDWTSPDVLAALERLSASAPID